MYRYSSGKEKDATFSAILLVLCNIDYVGLINYLAPVRSLDYFDGNDMNRYKTY